MHNDLDPDDHIAVGRALGSLRHDGVLIVGSGSSYHNRDRGPKSTAFDDWLTQAVCAPDPAERDRRLTRWTEAPFARDAHPREDHLIPLMVAAGAGGSDIGQRVFFDRIMNRATSAYRFG